MMGNEWKLIGIVKGNLQTGPNHPQNIQQAWNQVILKKELGQRSSDRQKGTQLDSDVIAA